MTDEEMGHGQVIITDYTTTHYRARANNTRLHRPLASNNYMPLGNRLRTLQSPTITTKCE
jgi:hypothetical protein